MNFGKSRTRFSMFAFAIAAMLFLVGPAKADQIFFFSFAGATVSGSGMLNATDNGDGSFTAVSGSGTQTVGVAAPDTLTLIFNPNGTTISFSPGGFFFDNQLFPGNDPLISDAGLLFSSSTQEVNLFSNIGGGYQFAQQDGFAEAITFLLSDSPPVQTVPEPTSMVLFGIGLLAFAAFRRRQL